MIQQFQDLHTHMSTVYRASNCVETLILTSEINLDGNKRKVFVSNVSNNCVVIMPIHPHISEQMIIRKYYLDANLEGNGMAKSFSPAVHVPKQNS